MIDLIYYKCPAATLYWSTVGVDLLLIVSVIGLVSMTMQLDLLHGPISLRILGTGSEFLKMI